MVEAPNVPMYDPLHFASPDWRQAQWQARLALVVQARVVKEEIKAKLDEQFEIFKAANILTKTQRAQG
ncbi:hypothetical protein LTR78_004985 [Recurvomyces mirabilis]|uniref:Uncharacterized protein n=1 Tax=Recurvomyces mirabilis TaxID=574656 RepID=A0AAE0WNI5_9PEZI|nr:hypothetical protein LTR78_004985 [Recurvomyces mirabilis]KAK5158399.1 hypothetical protein LTS14_003417 [Recurvomyces mirabilis]